MENEPVLTERQKRNRADKEAQRIPNAVAAMYALLKDFFPEQRKRIVDSVTVLLGDDDGK